MKIVAKAIEVVSWTNTDGKINPIRFRISNDDKSISVIKVDKVITIDKEKFAGNNMLVFKCQGIIKGSERLYELKYELGTCKWILFKI
jgi:hypothetical protein